MCGFVLFDTQLIIEKAENGDQDYIWHCIDLFLDFITLFRKLMMILAMNEKPLPLLRQPTCREEELGLAEDANFRSPLSHQWT
ncbi:Bax inhibitor 1 [Saguinus oedipus]|uniref:Bax inhibitor 1 n=1 Tax=Saguinus oedipus TaxID=9490 RepID=A0ABQ9UYL6_SAGOE|nr:Bax inhibitor 1 [Saguinus oedipus]